ncbi:MAG: hypothetical protein ACKOW9_00220 [Candidatus Paceibacterota bacterium]
MNNSVHGQRRVGILRGGQDDRHDISLREGSELLTFVLENMYPKWRPLDIYVDKEGVWHLQGKPILPSDLMQKVDLVWNSASPEYTTLLRMLSVPTLGQEAFMELIKHPVHFSQFAKQADIKTVRRVILPVYQPDIDGIPEAYAAKKAREVWQKFPAPWVVRSYNTDHNVAARVAKTFPELLEAIVALVLRGDSVLVEELIPGKVVSAHVLPGFRNQSTYQFPLSALYPLSVDEKKDISHTVNQIVPHINTSYIRVDMVMHPRTGIHVLGISFTPDCKEGSHFNETCEHAGVRMSNAFDHLFESILVV